MKYRHSLVTIMDNEKNLPGISIIIPALNEEQTIETVIDDTLKSVLSLQRPYEIIVIDDGSSDQTASIAIIKKVRLIQHPISGGYGLSLRDGIFAAKYNHIAIIDADGTYPANKIADLIKALDQYHMAIGARYGSEYKKSLWKYPLRKIFQLLCEFVTGRSIPDSNSGLRAFRKDIVMKFSDTFCLGFSFTTTITLAFHLNGYFVKYIPIEYYKRRGKSHVRLFKDSLRTTQILTQAILYYNPIKLFLLLTIVFMLAGIAASMFYFVHDWLFAALLGQIFFLAGFLFLGMGLIPDAIRQKR